MMLSRYIKILLLSILVIITTTMGYCTDELITDFEEDDLPVLNEEMRKLDYNIDSNTDDIASITTIVSQNEIDIASNTTLIQNIQDDTAIQGWANITYAAGVPTLNDHYNVSGINDDNTGRVTVSWDTDFASTSYSVVVTPISSGGNSLMGFTQSLAAGSVQVVIQNLGGAYTDPTGVCVMATGDQ